MQTVHQWANTVTKMTKVFGLFSFGVDVDMIRDDYETRGAIRLRAASFQSSRPKSSISSSSSHITINNRIALQTEKSFGSSLGSAVEVTQNPSSPLPALVAESAPSSSLLFNLDNEIAALDPPPSPMHPIRLPPVGGAPTSLTDGGLLEGAMPITKAVALVENDSALKQELRDANKSSTHSIKSHQSAEGVNEKLERSTGAANGYGGSTNLHLPTSGQNFLSKVNDFPNLLTITWWNAASGSFVWKNLLCCLGDVNKLSNPQNHAEAMNCLSQTWDMLAKIRSAQTYENAQIPPLFDFFPWFAKATELSSDFAEGRECGYSSLCKLMAKRHEQPLELDVVSHFYRCILRGLGTDDLKVVSSILSNSTAIFLVNLPGSSILIPHFVRAINKLLVGSRDNTSVSTIVRQSAIKILHSMSAIPNLHLQTSMFSTSDLPRLPNSHLTVAEGLSSSSDIMRSLSEPFLPKKRAEGTNRSLSREDSISTDDEFSPLSDSIFDSSRSLAEETLTIPSLDWNNPAITEDHVTFDEIKTQITDLYSSLLKDEGNLKCSETTAMLIWGVSALCCEELFNSSRLKGNMGETCLNLLLSQLTSKDAKSVSAAVDGLSLLASNSLILRRVEARTLINVVEKIVGAIGEHILCNQARVSRESRNLIVTRLLYCLLDWMMLLPNHIIEESTVSVLIFEVLESCLELGSEYDGSETATAAKAVHGNANMRANSLLSAAVAKVAMSPVPGVPIAQTALTVTAGTGTETTRGKLEAEEDDDDFVVKEAAENVLLHFSHHFNNFAPPYGAAIMNSQYVESILSEEMKENDRTIFFTLNDTTILTFCMCYTSGDAKARIIMRDLTGRYVWDYENFWQGLADVCCENPQGEKQFSQGFTLPIHQNVESEDSKPDAFGCEIAGDELNSLIQSIRQENEDCLEHMKSSGSIEDEGFSEQAAQMSEIIERNVSTEAFYHDKFRKNNSLVYRRFQKLAGSKGFVLEQPPASTALDDFANFPRLYLTQMGHINFDSLKDGYLHILAKSPALIRDIKGLDRKMGREVMKVAIIYVGPGQEEEQVLLRNGRGSAEYEEFVLSLGWEVDVQSHLGYLGGLEKSQATGSTAVYYCDSRTEIIFHDITRFPLDPEDPKQLKRKRHIGNDHVHIIWNEHYRDYKRTTIGGDFGNAQIVITPLANKLYSVDIMKDSKVASFGPLQHRMAVSKGVLGPLVRATAANAFRSALHIGQIHSGPPHAFSQRLSDIKTIISRHANSKSTFQTFFLALFNQPKKGEKYCE
ncbi:hypothetical protein DFJ73DRAFT_276580 [Zopfochytrium polystomum]|nr:hypothetical protein DFJ73DRAFT_276580 [Zopfochytrium polystomum]